jgi:hypothetical protein
MVHFESDRILIGLTELPAPTPGERLRVLIDPPLCEAARMIAEPVHSGIIPYLLKRGSADMEVIYQRVAKDAGVTLEDLYLAFRVLHAEEGIGQWLNPPFWLQ